jgi:hypothetical protein
VAVRPLLHRVDVCHGFAPRGLIERPHRVLESSLGRVQVRRGLGQICVPEHFLDVVQRPALFELSAPGLVPEIMEMENGGLASSHDLPWPIR